jgi:hypothetical protein
MHVHSKIKTYTAYTSSTNLHITGHNVNLIVAESNSSFRKNHKTLSLFYWQKYLLGAAHNMRKMVSDQE